MHLYIVGMVGYDGQQKCANCDTCGLRHSTLCILNPIFHRVWQICCAYNWLISRFSYFYVHDNDDDKTNCFTPLHMHAG